MDNDLMEFARRSRCRYTRYADDLTFSTSGAKFPCELLRIENGIELGKSIVSIIESHGFKINYSKVRYFPPRYRQEVTGLTVNDFPNVQRPFVRSITGALNAWEKHGYQEANKVYSERYRRPNGGLTIRSRLRGELCFLSMVLGQDAPICRKAIKRFNALNPENGISLRPLVEVRPYPLRGDSPKQTWRLWFDRYAKSICFAEIETTEGDKRTATAFCVGGTKIVTAKHNLKYPQISLYVDDKPVHIQSVYPPYDGNMPDIAIVLSTPADVVGTVGIPTQMRLPEIGEEVAAIGFPVLPQRHPTLVMHTGFVEAVPITFCKGFRFIQVSFQSGGGLSGAPLIDRRGYVIGVMVENIFAEVNEGVPVRPYGQAVPIEYFWDLSLETKI